MTGRHWNSDTINVNDLAIMREVIPFLKIRFRILRQRLSSSQNGRQDNVLIVMPCIIGDCLACLPAVHAFAERNRISVDVLVSPEFRPLAERLKYVRNVFVACSSYRRPSERCLSALQNLPSEYDLMVVLRISPEAFNMIRHVRCRHIISSDMTLVKYLAHMTKASLLHKSVMQSREVMFSVFGIGDTISKDDLYSLLDTECDGDNHASLNRCPLVHERVKRVLIHTGSGWQVKLWDDDRWVDLARRLHGLGPYQIYFVGGSSEERAMFERVRRKLNFKVYSLIGEISLWDLFRIMRHSDYFIGVDSGPRNLAHYANLPSVSLLNPAALKNFMPLEDRDIIIEHPNRFPANIVNTKKGANLSVISVDEVFQAFLNLSSSPAIPGTNYSYSNQTIESR